MYEIVNVYKQEYPQMRFIGKKYGDEHRVDGGFGAMWQAWNENGWFDELGEHIGEQGKLDAEDGEAWIGLMRWKEGEPFQYWIGKFVDPSCAVPGGYGNVDFPQSTLGICWVKGHEPDIFAKEHICAEKLKEQGHIITMDDQQAYWFFERYVDSRFMKREDDGTIIVDIGHFIQPA